MVVLGSQRRKVIAGDVAGGCNDGTNREDVSDSGKDRGPRTQHRQGHAAGSEEAGGIGTDSGAGQAEARSEAVVEARNLRELP